PGRPAPALPPGKNAAPMVKILDWGLARVMPPPSESEPAPPDSVTRGELNAEKGALVGTADYIAPEQARDATLVDTRAAIYSLGCTFFFLLTGRTPFPGAGLMQKLMQHQEAEPPSVCELRPDVPPELDALIRRMLAKQPADRYQIPLLVIAQLRHYCPG